MTLSCGFLFPKLNNKQHHWNYQYFFYFNAAKIIFLRVCVCVCVSVFSSLHTVSLCLFVLFVYSCMYSFFLWKKSIIYSLEKNVKFWLILAYSNSHFNQIDQNRVYVILVAYGFVVMLKLQGKNDESCCSPLINLRRKQHSIYLFGKVKNYWKLRQDV